MGRRWGDNGWATVVALDPGGTTGWCVMCVEADALADPDISILKSIVHQAQGQVGGAENSQLDALIDLVAAWPHSALVIEGFTLRKYIQSAELLSPVRLTSVLDYVYTRSLGGIEPHDDALDVPRRWFKQDPSMAKNVATDERLKQWGLYIREGGEEHARDASRHAITFLRRASDRPALRHAAWPHLYNKAGELDPVED